MNQCNAFPELLFDRPPKGFTAAQPVRPKKYRTEELSAMENQGQLIAIRDHAGWNLIILKKGKEVKIFTRGLVDISDRVTHLTYDLRRFVIPSNTVLIGKGIFDDKGRDDPCRTASCFSVNRKKHRDIGTEIPNMKLVLYDALIWAGTPFCRMVPYSLRRSYLEAVVKLCGFRNSKRRIRGGGNPKVERSRFVSFAEELPCRFEEAQNVAKERNWAGLLFYRRNSLSDFRLDGKTPRNNRSCYRWKPT